MSCIVINPRLASAACDPYWNNVALFLRGEALIDNSPV